MAEEVDGRGDVLREQGEYWKETLAGAPDGLELPGDHARPARQEYAGGVFRSWRLGRS